MSISPAIFKAYDVRGIYPTEVNEDAARAIGRAFVAYLDAKRIAVSRDMRVSSPAIAAAFIEGARAQGADVIDYGLCATDMMYFAVVRDGLDGGAQITASHNPKEYNGIKMVRREAFPLSGDAGIGEIRDMVTNGRDPGARRGRRAGTSGAIAARRLRREGHVVHRPGGRSRPFNVVLDAGSGMGGLVAPRLFDRLPCRTTRLVLRDRRHVSRITRPTRSSRRTAATSSSASSPSAPTSASPGTATPIAASSSTAPASSSPATSSRRCWRKRR